MADIVQYGDPGQPDPFKNIMYWLGKQYRTGTTPARPGSNMGDIQYSGVPSAGVMPVGMGGYQGNTGWVSPGQLSAFRSGAGLAGAMAYNPVQEMQYMGLGTTGGAQRYHPNVYKPALPATSTLTGAGGLSPYISDTSLASTAGANPLLASTQPVQYGPPLPPDPAGGQGEGMKGYIQYLADQTGRFGGMVYTESGVEGHEGEPEGLMVRKDAYGNVTSFTPVSGATLERMKRSGSIYHTVGRSNAGAKSMYRRWRAGRQRSGRGTGGYRPPRVQPVESDVSYSEWYSADRGNKYGVKSGKGKKWSNSSMRTYNEWVGKEGASTAAGSSAGSAYPNWVINMSNWRGI